MFLFIEIVNRLHIHVRGCGQGWGPHHGGNSSWGVKLVDLRLDSYKIRKVRISEKIFHHIFMR